MGRVGAILLIGFTLHFALAVSPAAPEAKAQESGIVLAQDRGGLFPNLFRFLFREPEQQPLPPAPVPGSQRNGATSRPRTSAPSAPSPQEIAAVAKADDADRVMVVGDFFSRALARGLAEAHAEDPDLLVIDASNGSSGLVRDDFYNWPAALEPIVDAQSPDVILVLIGGNDRQTIRSGGYELGTDAWRAAYVERVAQFADALRATGRPILWVGLPPVESSSLSRDYSSFNGIYREQLEAKRIRFIETWNGFADEQGHYVAIGPDIRGQSIQLRTSDGLNFTRAGQRKLAFFAEQDLARILGGGGLLGGVDTAVAAGEPASLISPMVPLDALRIAGGEALSASSTEEAGHTADSMMAARLAGEDAAMPPEGRIDYYLWPALQRPAPQSPPNPDD